MSSAFRFFTSAAGIGSACYLLAMASWEQVLLLFLATSLGWCLFVWRTSKRNAAYGPRFVTKRSPELLQALTAPKRQISFEEAHHPQLQEAPTRRIYRFPIHELANASIPKHIEAFD